MRPGWLAVRGAHATRENADAEAISDAASTHARIDCDRGAPERRCNQWTKLSVTVSAVTGGSYP